MGIPSVHNMDVVVSRWYTNVHTSLKAIPANKKIAEIKGLIREVEVFPFEKIEWWFVPIKTGVFDDLYCKILNKKKRIFL